MNDEDNRGRQAQKSVLNQIIKLSKFWMSILKLNEGENIIDEGSNKNNNNKTVKWG